MGVQCFLSSRCVSLGLNRNAVQILNMNMPSVCSKAYMRTSPHISVERSGPEQYNRSLGRGLTENIVHKGTKESLLRTTHAYDKIVSHGCYVGIHG